jgi:hypothetical protein
MDLSEKQEIVALVREAVEESITPLAREVDALKNSHKNVADEVGKHAGMLTAHAEMLTQQARAITTAQEIAHKAALDPTQATAFKLLSVRLDYQSTPHQMILLFEYRDAGGNVVNTRDVVANDAAVQTYLTNQEANILARLMSRIGVTGTVV